MVSFKFTVKDDEGIHARPAGMLLVKHVGSLSSAVEIEFNGKESFREEASCSYGTRRKMRK